MLSVLTLGVLERAKDFPLRRNPFDVGMVFKRLHPSFLILVNPDHFEVTGVIAGWVVAGHNPPVVYVAVLECS